MGSIRIIIYILVAWVGWNLFTILRQRQEMIVESHNGSKYGGLVKSGMAKRGIYVEDRLFKWHDLWGYRTSIQQGRLLVLFKLVNDQEVILYFDMGDKRKLEQYLDEYIVGESCEEGKINYEALVDYYSWMIELTPSKASLYQLRALYYTQMEKYEEALADYRQQIECAEDDYKPYFNAGTTLIHLNRSEEAVAYFSKVISLQVQCQEVYLYRGMAYEKIGNHEASLMDFKKYIELVPGSAYGYYERAKLLTQLKRYEEALQDIEKVMLIDPHFKKIEWCKADILFEQGAFELALAYYERAEQRETKNPELYEQKAKVYEALRKGPLALEMYEKAIDLQPDRDISLKAIKRLKEGEVF